jgi:hypothetical protein
MGAVHAGKVIEKPLIASHPPELGAEPQAIVVLSTTANLFPVRCREGPISRQLFLGTNLRQVHGMATLVGGQHLR